MLSQIAKDNLEKDEKVLGREWLKTYNNYFSDEENIQIFIKSVKPFLPNKELKILYVGSASGLLGEKLVDSLCKGELTLVDISQKHLDQNKNDKTRKICCDLLNMDLHEKFDLIIMRSSLDYFSSEKLQVTVLEIIKNHLEKDGLFINQPAYVSSLKDRDILSEIYNETEKIGNRYFQSADLDSIYRKAGLDKFKKIGAGKDLLLTEKEHIERYKIDKEDIDKIQKIIGKDSDSAQETEHGYILKFEFPIFLAS